MPSKQITLLVRLTNFDTVIQTVVDNELLPIVANMNKVTHFFVQSLPQEAQQLFIQQFTVFLEYISAAGDEANLMREYLGNCFSEGDDSPDLLTKALSVLTGKALSLENSLEDVSAWAQAVVSALGEPCITRLVVVTLLSGAYLPDPEEKEFRRLYLSLLK